MMFVFSFRAALAARATRNALAAMLLMSVGTGAHGQTPSAPAIALTNPGFEGAYRSVTPTGDTTSRKARISGDVAEGWGDNSDWADVTVQYARDTTNPHRGEASQRVSVERVGGGAVQFVQSVPLKKGRVYEWRVWLKGRPGSGVTLGLRQKGAPYTEVSAARVILTAEWQEFSLIGPSPADTEGLLMVRTGEPTTFWVDDARLFDVTDSTTNAAPREGNFLSGGSFEAGVSFGWSVRFEGSQRHRWSDPRPRVDPATASVGAGRQSLRCDAPVGAEIRISSPTLSFNVARPHAASVWVKASSPGTYVSIHLENTDLQKSATVGTEWQRVTLDGTLPYRQWTRLRITTPRKETPRTLWVDGAMLEEKAESSPGFVPAAAHDVVLLLPRPGRIVFDGEKAAVQISTSPGLPGGARLRRSVTDLSGKTQALADIVLPATSFPLPDFRARSRGMFKLQAQIVDTVGKPLSSPVEMVWARLPRPRPIPAEKSFFGMHVPLAPDFVRAAVASGTKWTRLHDTSMVGKWVFAEPEPGHWEFYDQSVTGTKQLGLSILGMLDGAPGRVSTRPREGYWGVWHIPDAPGAGEAWENYVRTVVSHYKGRIDHWEVWNEPWGNWFLGAGGKPELYGDLLKRAYKTAHAASPKATVIGIDTYAGHEDTWTVPALRASGPAFYDGFSFHDYSDALYNGGLTGVPAQRVREFERLQSPLGTPKPQWNTEGGLSGVGSWYAPITGGMPPRLQAGYMIRYDVSYLAAGVRHFFLYAMHTDPAMGDPAFTAIEHDRAIKPMLAARAVLAYLVDGAGRPKYSAPVKGVEAYTFAPVNSRKVTVLWSGDGAPHSLPVPRGTTVLDALGNPVAGKTATVGLEPIYFLTK